MASIDRPNEIHSLSSLIKTLTNAQLRDILRSEGLAVSGVKTALQLRIIEYTERLWQSGRIEAFDRLKKFIYATARRVFPGLSTTQPSPGRHHPSHAVPRPLSAQPGSSPLSVSTPSHPVLSGSLLFKDSPFYTILETLTPPVECKVREQTRDSVEMRVILSQSHATRLQSDPRIRVMVYCAADTGLNSYTKSDVAFPYQVELKANLDEVKANLRGLKNKPGTTRPADITDYIRKKPGYPNLIVMTYALTQRRFFAVVSLVQRHPVEQLVAGLKARKTITKEQVLREMRSKADDSDIVATSSVMSLKCPLSTLRIDVPCRSVICTHNQCFDASSFLQLQEQAPTWSCPVCSKSASFESLQIDQYVDDILRSTPLSLEQVIVEPNGRWLTPGDTTAGQSTAGELTPTTDGGEGLVELKEFLYADVKQEQTSDNILLQTPADSRILSNMSPANPLSSNKRTAAVIDLTGSDSDEDALSDRPTKRPALNKQQEAQSAYSNGDDLLSGLRLAF